MRVGDGEGLVGVDGAPVLRAHHVWVDVVGIGATTSTVAARVVVGGDVVAGVQGRGHGVLVALERVILRTEVFIHKVGVTVVVATWAWYGSK